MRTTEQINSFWELSRQQSADGEILRRRIAAIGAIALGIAGFLFAIGFGVVVLVLLGALAASVGVAVFLTQWPRLRAFGAKGIAYSRDRSRALRDQLGPLRQKVAHAARTTAAVGARIGRRVGETARAATPRLRSFGAAGIAYGSDGSRALRNQLGPLRQKVANAARATPPVGARFGRSVGENARATTIRFARRTALLDPHREAVRLNAAGTQQRRSGRYDEAVESHRQALEIMRALGDRRGVALTQSNLALALSHAGDDVWAVGLFEEAAATLHELGDEEHEARIMANLGVTHRRHGRPEEGDNVLELALSKLTPTSSAYRAIEAELRRAS
jgi:tetratricopeptide (TPR) repeat protein